MKVNYISLLSSLALTFMVMFVFYQKMNPPSLHSVKINQGKTNLRLVYKMPEDDEMQLYHRKSGTGYVDDASIKRNIKGKPRFQSVNFFLPKNTEFFRLDINKKATQNDIFFKEMILINGETKIRLVASELFGVLNKKNRFIEEVSIQEKLLYIKTTPVEGQYNPYFWDISLDSIYSLKQNEFDFPEKSSE